MQAEASTGLPASCAVAVDACEDTDQTSFDAGWLVIPAVVISVVVIAAMIWYAARGSRG